MNNKYTIIIQYLVIVYQKCHTPKQGRGRGRGRVRVRGRGRGRHNPHKKRYIFSSEERHPRTQDIFIF